MKYYAIVEFDITDRSWISDYVAQVTPLVERHGGRYLARTSRIEKLEGDRDPAQLCVLIEWPSHEAATAFYESAEYRPHRESRLRGTRGRMILVAGEDVTRSPGAQGPAAPATGARR